MIMKYIELPTYTLNIVRAAKSMSMKEKPAPHPGKGQVRIRIRYAPCNPSDISFIQGRYGFQKPLPATPGFEGMGTVIETGEGTESLDGKRVSCFSQYESGGTWSEEFITSASNCIPLKDDMPDEQASCFAINPFTAYALFHRVKNRHQAVILNAAGGQVSRLFAALACEAGIEIIKIVRKTEVDTGSGDEQRHVINQHDADFLPRLKALASSLNATIALDAVGGSMTGDMLNNMPAGSQVIVYGGLSGKPLGNIHILEIVFGNKTITGFDLNQWIGSLAKDEFHDISQKLQEMFIRKKLTTKIQGIYPLGDFEKGLFRYIKNMSAGKILFSPVIDPGVRTGPPPQV